MSDTHESDQQVVDEVELRKFLENGNMGALAPMLIQHGFTSLKRISECNSVEFESILELLSRGALQEMFSYLFNELQANGLEYSQNFGVRDPPLMLKQQAKEECDSIVREKGQFSEYFGAVKVSVPDLVRRSLFIKQSDPQIANPLNVISESDEVVDPVRTSHSGDVLMIFEHAYHGHLTDKVTESDSYQTSLSPTSSLTSSATLNPHESSSEISNSVQSLPESSLTDSSSSADTTLINATLASIAADQSAGSFRVAASVPVVSSVQRMSGFRHNRNLSNVDLTALHDLLASRQVVQVSRPVTLHDPRSVSVACASADQFLSRGNSRAPESTDSTGQLVSDAGCEGGSWSLSLAPGIDTIEFRQKQRLIRGATVDKHNGRVWQHRRVWFSMALDKLVWGAVDDSVPHQFELCSDLAAVCKVPHSDESIFHLRLGFAKRVLDLCFSDHAEGQFWLDSLERIVAHHRADVQSFETLPMVSDQYSTTAEVSVTKSLFSWLSSKFGSKTPSESNDDSAEANRNRSGTNEEAEYDFCDVGPRAGSAKPELIDSFQLDQSDADQLEDDKKMRILMRRVSWLRKQNVSFRQIVLKSSAHHQTAALLTEGAMFRKLQKTGLFQVRHIQLSPNFDWLEWSIDKHQPAKGSLKIQDIIQIVMDPIPSNPLVFQLQAKRRILTLECMTKHEKSKWTNALLLFTAF